MNRSPTTRLRRGSTAAEASSASSSATRFGGRSIAVSGSAPLTVLDAVCRLQTEAHRGLGLSGGRAVLARREADGCNRCDSRRQCSSDHCVAGPRRTALCRCGGHRGCRSTRDLQDRAIECDGYLQVHGRRRCLDRHIRRRPEVMILKVDHVEARRSYCTI
jgi:hypothetical protein